MPNQEVKSTNDTNNHYLVSLIYLSASEQLTNVIHTRHVSTNCTVIEFAAFWFASRGTETLLSDRLLLSQHNLLSKQTSNTPEIGWLSKEAKQLRRSANPKRRKGRNPKPELGSSFTVYVYYQREIPSQSKAIEVLLYSSSLLLFLFLPPRAANAIVFFVPSGTLAICCNMRVIANQSHSNVKQTRQRISLLICSLSASLRPKDPTKEWKVTSVGLAVIKWRRTSLVDKKWLLLTRVFALSTFQSTAIK